MSDLFASFGSNASNGNQISQQDDVLANLLQQQHQLSQALKQHQLEQQREQQNQLKSFNTPSIFLNKVISFWFLLKTFNNQRILNIFRTKINR